MATQASKQQWFDELIGSVRSLGGAGTAHLVVDLASGRVVASSPGAADLLGGTIPDHVEDLRTSGLLSSPQFRDLRALVGTGPTGAPIDGEAPATETAQSWTDRVRLHRPDGSTIQVDLNLVVHRRPKFPAEVVMVTATPTDAEDAPAPDGEWWTLLDEEMRVVAADEAFNPHVVDPAQMIGVLAAVLVHPDDLPEILPTVMAVVRGVAATAEYTVRLVTAEGGWITAHRVLHRLGSLDGPLPPSRLSQPATPTRPTTGTCLRQPHMWG